MSRVCTRVWIKASMASRKAMFASGKGKNQCRSEISGAAGDFMVGGCELSGAAGCFTARRHELSGAMGYFMARGHELSGMIG
jgi:hypothetical protein